MKSIILKNSRKVILILFTILVNECISQCLLIMLICEKGENTVPENYRPISIISMFGKAIELILQNRFGGYFEKFQSFT